MEAAETLKSKLSDREWRLNNLYKIVNAQGRLVTFKPNAVQRDFFNNIHNFNVILKARQLGFSTFILILILDTCLFKPNQSAGVIAQGLNEAEDLFKNKIKLAYDNLPEWLKEARAATTDSARKIQFDNGSLIQVGTSLRGGTMQLLHISEYGKIAARYPEKAVEIKTGALNTVHAGQLIFVESTAEGQQGEFYELVERAQALKLQGKPLTQLDPLLHFYPWYNNPDYALDSATGNVSIAQKMDDYFTSLNNVRLTPGQKAWYVKKAEQQGEYMKREYPSTTSESFEQSMEGAIYKDQMAKVRQRGQIGHWPHDPSKKVYTFWDLGKGSDYTSIWFFQMHGTRKVFIDYHESHGEGWAFYANMLASKGYVYAEHVLPHDAKTITVGKNLSTSKRDLEELGVRPIRVVPRTNDVWADIKGTCRNVLVNCYFDESKCDDGIKHLDNYRREWDDKRGVWKDKPRHDQASHCADAYRTFAMGFREEEHLPGFMPASVGQAEDYDPFNY